jgi:hypothetical protein
LMHKEIFISCKCTHWLKHCCLEAKFIILAEMERYEDILQLKIHPLYFINFY